MKSTDQHAETGRAGETYFPEIDGLRAIAVLLVVAFHAGIQQLSGGFIGVDVFFVISGFLITGLLLRELEESGRIDLLDFYARRARRLMPALTVVLIFTIAASTLLLTPVGEQQQLAQSAIAASVFLANVFFWRNQSSYFAGSADAMPLLHLWTLSVEEQFYIVWPVTMIVVAAIARRWSRPGALRLCIMSVLIAACTSSLLACWWFTPSRATMTFYTTPFRAWEFGLGAILALWGSKPVIGEKSAFVSTAGGLLLLGGLSAVVFSAFWFSRETVFPGVTVALPVVGAAAMILGMRFAAGTLPARMLASTPMITIGKLSYSWYLWHWPLLALARAALPGQISIWRDCGLVLVALALSALTFRCVEEPVRRKRPWPFARAATAVTAGVLLMVSTAGLATVLWAGAEWRVGRDHVLTAAATALSEKSEISVECTNFRLPFAGLASSDACMLGKSGGTPFVVLWGDSHADHFIPGLVQWAEKSGGRLLPRTMGSCKPQMMQVPNGLLAVARANAESCIAFNAAVLATLPGLRAQGASTVILAGRWSVPSQLQNGLGDWGTDLRTRIMDLKSMGFDVVLFAETPLRRIAVPQCLARSGPAACNRLRSEVDVERAPAIAILKRIAGEIAGVKLWDPISEVCSDQICPAMRDGQVLFSDDSHLSLIGSKLLAPTFTKILAGNK